MKIETQFSIGDKVFSIIHATRSVDLPCPACKGEGKIKYPDDTLRSCSECYGHKTKREYVQGHWYIEGLYTIGLVRFQEPKRDDTHNESYMCVETGVGSGSVYYGDRLFTEQEAAQAECDKRNEDEGVNIDRWNELVEQGYITHNEPRTIIREVSAEGELA